MRKWFVFFVVWVFFIAWHFKNNWLGFSYSFICFVFFVVYTSTNMVLVLGWWCFVPRGYTQLVVYLESKEEREKIKALASQLGVSVSELIRAFFRSLLSQADSIRVDQRNLQFNIGALQIAVVQQNNIQQNNIIMNIKLSLEEAISYLEAALESREYSKMLGAIRLSLPILKKIVKKL